MRWQDALRSSAPSLGGITGYTEGVFTPEMKGTKQGTHTFAKTTKRGNHTAPASRRKVSDAPNRTSSSASKAPRRKWSSMRPEMKPKLTASTSRGAETATSTRPRQKCSITAAMKQEILDIHNKLRAQHGIHTPLQWSDECAASAQRCAKHCEMNGMMDHCYTQGPSGHHGQNIACCSAGMQPRRSCELWYDELYSPGYSYSEPGLQPEAGHFTQVVWAATTHVGGAQSSCGNFHVCNYFPAGNVQGQFLRQVPPFGGF